MSSINFQKNKSDIWTAQKTNQTSGLYKNKQIKHLDCTSLRHQLRKSTALWIHLCIFSSPMQHVELRKKSTRHT